MIRTTRRSLLLASGLLVLPRLAIADEPAAASSAAPPPPVTPRTPIVGPKLDELFREIAKARQSVRSFAGPFTQTRKMGLMRTQILSQGRVSLVVPDRLRWDLLPPDEVTYWVTPEGLSYRNRSSQGAVRSNDAKSLSAGLEDLRAMLGGDLSVLRKRYDVKAFAVGDDVEFEATALASADARGMKAVRFGIAKDRVRPTFTRLVEKNGDTSDIRFGELRTNVPLDPQTMHL
jgi:outer membrane lipoprotein-sorting protein